MRIASSSSTRKGSSRFGSADLSALQGSEWHHLSPFQATQVGYEPHFHGTYPPTIYERVPDSKEGPALSVLRKCVLKKNTSGKHPFCSHSNGKCPYPSACFFDQQGKFQSPSPTPTLLTWSRYCKRRTGEPSCSLGGSSQPECKCLPAGSAPVAHGSRSKPK